MDEKLVEEISSSTGVPQELVSRSAQARAEANGVDINNIVLMKVKEPQEQQHKNEATQDKIHGLIDRLSKLNTVRNEVKTRNTQHQPRDCILSSQPLGCLQLQQPQCTNLQFYGRMCARITEPRRSLVPNGG